MRERESIVVMGLCVSSPNLPHSKINPLRLPVKLDLGKIKGFNFLFNETNLGYSSEAGHL